MSQFQNLDDLIVAQITNKGIHFTPLFSSNAVREESQRLGTELGREPFRVLDGRLQALKRKGAISYGTKTGWVKSEPKQVTLQITKGNQQMSQSESKAAKPGGMAKAVWESSDAAGRLMLPKNIKVVVSCFEEGGQTCLIFPDGSSFECLGLNFDRIYWGEVGGATYDLKPL